MSERPPEYTFEHNDCGIRAISFALDRPYGEIHTRCAYHGRKPRKGTPWPVIEAVMLEYGYPMIRSEPDFRVRATVRTIKHYMPGQCIALLYTAKHLVGYRNGQMSEQSLRRVKFGWRWELRS